MTLDELGRGRQVVLLGREVEIVAFRALVSLTESGPGFAGVRIVVPDRHLDDAGLEGVLRHLRHLGLHATDCFLKGIGWEVVGVEPDQQ